MVCVFVEPTPVRHAALLKPVEATEGLGPISLGDNVGRTAVAQFFRMVVYFGFRTVNFRL
jgi:hypothetical protein